VCVGGAVLKLQSMGMHARSLPTADKERCLAILRQHQQEVQDLKKKLLQAEITFTVRCPEQATARPTEEEGGFGAS